MRKYRICASNAALWSARVKHDVRPTHADEIARATDGLQGQAAACRKRHFEGGLFGERRSAIVFFDDQCVVLAAKIPASLLPRLEAGK
jgi:hypothetical protein